MLPSNPEHRFPGTITLELNDWEADMLIKATLGLALGEEMEAAHDPILGRVSAWRGSVMRQIAVKLRDAIAAKTAASEE